jgi:hypothetical protein
VHRKHCVREKLIWKRSVHASSLPFISTGNLPS